MNISLRMKLEKSVEWSNWRIIIVVEEVAATSSKFQKQKSAEYENCKTKLITVYIYQTEDINFEYLRKRSNFARFVILCNMTFCWYLQSWHEGQAHEISSKIEKKSKGGSL